MQALEFESSINGNKLEIPAHLMRKIPAQSRIKVIMLMQEHSPSQTDDLNS